MTGALRRTRQTAGIAHRMSVPAALVLALGGVPGAWAAELGPGLFDVDQRRTELQQPDHAAARDACLAIGIDAVLPLPEPIEGLYPTEAYGTDNSAEDYAWAVMVLSGRSLAGDAAAGDLLVEALTSWAAADALADSPTHYDPFFAIKRTMLPTMVAYRIAAERMSPDDEAMVRDWIDRLVRRLDATFDGDVDHNNHRYLADLALMTWGSIVRDRALVDKGMERYATGLGQARPDGSLPLETRRGARAMWYTNIALGEFTAMAEVARVNGRDLYGLEVGGVGHETMLGFLLDVVETPALMLPYAAENTIPGPDDDYRRQDLGFLATRGHGRHYMAWTEAVVAQDAGSPETRRLTEYFQAELADMRPLIDDYTGGNASCFWMTPASAKPGQ